MTNTILSLVRTYVPVAVGALAAWLLTLGVELNAEAQTGLTVFLTGLIVAVYYTVARLLERKWPALGFLLGSTKQPVYDTPPVPEQPVNVPAAEVAPAPRNYPQF